MVKFSVVVVLVMTVETFFFQIYDELERKYVRGNEKKLKVEYVSSQVSS